MRFARPTGIALCLLLGASAAFADEARNILERAIQAHGGETHIRKSLKGHLQAQVEGKNEGNAIKSKYEEFFDLPARYLRRVDGAGGALEIHMTAAVNDKTGWIRQGRSAPQVFPVPEPTPPEQQWYAIPYLLLALQKNDARLTLHGAEKRDGHSLVELRAAAPRLMSEVSLWFDRETGLVARARRPMPEFMRLNLIAEIVFEKYRAIEGVRYPMHWQVTAGMNTSFTIDISTLEFLDRMDDSIFAKPAMPAAEKSTPSTNEPAEKAETTPAFDDREEAPANRVPRLLFLTLGVGAVIGGLWLFVRANKRRKQATNSL